MNLIKWLKVDVKESQCNESNDKHLPYDTVCVVKYVTFDYNWFPSNIFLYSKP